MNLSEIVRIGEVRRREDAREVSLTTNDGPVFGLTFSFEPLGPRISLPDWDEEGVQQRIKSFGEKAAYLHGAFAGDRLVGFSIAGELRHDRSVELIAQFVDVDYRNSGVGSQLLRKTEEYALSRDGARIFAYSNPTESALRFYLTHGFRVVGIHDRKSLALLEADIIVAKSLMN